MHVSKFKSYYLHISKPGSDNIGRGFAKSVFNVALRLNEDFSFKKKGICNRVVTSFKNQGVHTFKSYTKRGNQRLILVLSFKKTGGARAPLAPPVPTALCNDLRSDLTLVVL